VAPEFKRPRSWIVGGIYALVAVAGYQLSHRGAVLLGSGWTYLLVIVLVPVFAALVALAARIILSTSPGSDSSTDRPGWRQFAIRWGVVFLCWMPLWLAVYPGFFAYDANVELNYVLSGNYNWHHPPPHTWLLGFGVKFLHGLLGSWNEAIAVYVIAQALVIAAVFAWTLGRLQVWGARRWTIWAGFAYYALFPTVAMFALCTTKDVLFSLGLLVVCVLLVDCAKGRSRRRDLIALTVVASVVLLLRFNAVYAWVPFAAVVLIASKGRRRALAPVMIIPIVLGIFAPGVLYPHVLHYASPQLESKLSVPLQQMARVYIGADDVTPDERAAIERWWAKLDCLRAYTPQNSDPNKRGVNSQLLRRNVGAFLTDWARIGARHPAAYVNATLANTYQGWYPGAMITGYNHPGGPAYIYPPGSTSYFIFRTEDPGEAREPSLLPPVSDFYRGISKSPALNHVPVISWLFSPGALLMLLVFVLALAAPRGATGRAFFFPALLLVLMACTVFFGPVMLIRYFLSLFFTFPLVVAFLGRPAAFSVGKPHGAAEAEPAVEPVPVDRRGARRLRASGQ
jgi:hypothetical protein